MPPELDEEGFENFRQQLDQKFIAGYAEADRYWEDKRKPRD